MENKSKIIVFLMGGLGNQMFQYSAGFDFARKINGELFLDTTFLNDRFPRAGFTYRKYDLDVFNINPQFTKLSKISSSLKIPGVWLFSDLMMTKLQNKFGNLEVVRERDNNYFSKLNEAIETNSKNYFLFGYFQSEKYFIDSAKELRNEFSFKNEFSDNEKKIADRIKNLNSVSIHIRRGDYITSKKAKRVMKEFGSDYYKKAIGEISKKISDPHFFVFSDDIEWCKENLKIEFPTEYLGNDTAGYKNSRHLQLMSLCKHNIIANSSFSWWGAWLNNNPEKIVIAPKDWFNDRDENDLVPRVWKKV
jgi:hypothetical protein